MNNLDSLTLLIAVASVALGAFFGILGNHLILNKEKDNWKWAFYLFGIGVILFASACTIIYWNQILNAQLVTIIVILASLASGILIIICTQKVLNVKNVYRVSELDPIINTFTGIADRNEIQLFGGDLNFFGNSTNEIDTNVQYTYLRSLNFGKVLIICEQPDNATTKIRYGKILSEIPNAEFKYYHPEQADLRVRGRLIRVNGVAKLLMYTKIRQGYYQAIETDTADSKGALYNNIWELVWSMAKAPTVEENQSYIQMFRGGNRL